MDPFFIVAGFLLIVGVCIATLTFMSVDKVGFITAFRRLVGIDRSE